MKNKLTLLFVFLCIKALAQAPQSFSYQAIARDKDQKPLANASLTVEASILRNSQAVFKENHSAQTSGTGLFTLDIGSVNALAFQSINWALGGFSLQIKVSGDVNINVPAEPIQSVPYALYAAKTDPANIRLTLDGNTLGIDGGNSVVLPSNSSSTSLTINGQGLFLGGNATTGYVLQNTGDTNPSDDLTTASTASGDVSGKFQSLSVDKLKGQPLSGTSPQMGQILQWDGNAWKPSAAPVAGLTAISTDGTLAGNGTAATPLQLARQNAQPNQVLKWNGSSWVPADDVAAAGSTGAVAVATTLTGDGSISKPLNLAQQGAQTGQVLKWNGSAWAPAPDETLSGEAGGDLSGPFNNLSIRANSINSSHIAPGTIGAQDLSSMGAAPGEFLMYDGTQWVTKPIVGGGPAYTEGPGIDISGNTIANTGDLDSTDDLLKTSQAGGDLQGTFSNLQIKNGAVNGAKMAQMGAISGQVLKWNGTVWEPQNDIGGGNGDNWGTQAVVTGAALTGNGTSANPLNLAAGTSAGQVLKWDGSAWKPAADETGSGSGSTTTVTVTGSGLSITGNAVIGYTLRNTGDTDAGDDITTASQAGGDLSGTFPNLLIKDNAIGSIKIANGAVSSAKIAQMNATNGQVLKWDGSKWAPATDETGSGGSGATTLNVTGAGLRLTGNTTTGYTLQNTGDIDSTNDVTKATLAGGDLSGIFANLQINNGAVNSAKISDGSIFGQDLNKMNALDGQVLTYKNTTGWAPSTISGSSQWTTDANGIYYPPSNGDGTVRVNNGFGAKLLEMGPTSKTTPPQYSAYGHNTAGSLATYGANGQMNVYLTHLIDQNGNPLPNNGALSIYGTDGYRPYPPFIAYADDTNSGGTYLTNSSGNIVVQQGIFKNKGIFSLSNGLGNSFLNTRVSLEIDEQNNTGTLVLIGNQDTIPVLLAGAFRDAPSAGYLNLSESGQSRVLLGAATNGYAWFYGPNGEANVFMGSEISNPNHGYVEVSNTSGIGKAGMYVNTAGRGVLFADDIFAQNPKSFRTNHPLDPTKEIWYACIEGPEAGIYERGTAYLSAGETWIPFSEHFSAILANNSLTVTLTPHSADTYGLAIVEKTPNGIRVRELKGGKGTFGFDWEVKGVRKGYEDYQPVRPKEPWPSSTRADSKTQKNQPQPFKVKDIQIGKISH